MSSELSPELYEKWRSPRPGVSNPELQTNPVWVHLVETEKSAYTLGQEFGFPADCEAEPGWCFQRFGRTSTTLADGREILIGGEHEDHYDPDFYIYNDVVVRHPDGKIEIYGYPRDVFPPTDFHTATLVGNRIILIGALSYPERRRFGQTQVLALDLANFSLSTPECSGTPPGWIHRHRASLADDGNAILITGGEIETSLNTSRRENIDQWSLSLETLHWERLTDLRWPRWTLRRADGQANRIFETRTNGFLREHGLETSGEEFLELALPEGSADLDEETRRLLVEAMTPSESLENDRKIVETLYRPPLPLEAGPDSSPDDEDEFGVHRIIVDGVTVRYREGSFDVRVTVEGDLPVAKIETLQGDLLEKLQRLEGTEWLLEEVEEP